jgi:transposase
MRSLGDPTGFAPSPGQEAHDLDGADAPLPEREAAILIGDEAFDAEARVLAPLEQAGKTAVIPPQANRRNPRPHDRDLYKARHPIENFFAKLEQFRAIAAVEGAALDRQAGHELPGRHSPGSQRHPAQLTTGPSGSYRGMTTTGGPVGGRVTVRDGETTNVIVGR